MKLTREEYMASIASIIGDRTDDEALKFVEDMTDTFDGNVNTDNEETINTLNATIKELTDKNKTMEMKILPSMIYLKKRRKSKCQIFQKLLQKQMFLLMC